MYTKMIKSKKATKKNGAWILIAVLALVLIGALVQKNYNIPFTILPEGQFNHDSSCILITNSNPLEAAYNQYRHSDIWIAMDANGDGEKEAYGYGGQGSGSQRTDQCGRTMTPNNKLLLENYNQMGDDIYAMYSTSPTPAGWRVYFCSSDGKQYTTFKKQTGAYAQAIRYCDTPQENECSTPGVKKCTPNFGDNAYVVCMDQLRWNPTVEHCPSGQYCNNNVCSLTAPTCTNGQIQCIYGASYQTCINGHWSQQYDYCPSGQQCVNNQCQGPICTPNWQCTSWSTCSGNSQSRTCTDSNTCGVTTGKPITVQSCSGSCTPNWQCTTWSTCSGGTQSRTCSDSANCGLANPNSLTQSCNSGTTPTCSDGIKNGAETGIDCGGTCATCSSICKDTEYNLFGNCASKTLIWLIVIIVGAIVLLLVIKR